jgi:hypothetical protein
LQSCDFTADAYLKGVLDGAIVGGAGAIAVAMAGERTVYAGEFRPFVPFKERAAGLKYGGAALAVAGAAIAAFWSDVPVVRSVAVTPASGGFRVGASIGF